MFEDCDKILLQKMQPAYELMRTGGEAPAGTLAGAAAAARTPEGSQGQGQQRERDEDEEKEGTQAAKKKAKPEQPVEEMEFEKSILEVAAAEAANQLDDEDPDAAEAAEKRIATAVREKSVALRKARLVKKADASKKAPGLIIKQPVNKTQAETVLSNSGSHMSDSPVAGPEALAAARAALEQQRGEGDPPFG